jgi:hypothetical protein
MAPFDALVLGRARLAAAAGRPEQIGVRLDELDATFASLTAQSPTRRAGQTYAARRLVYEDCRRGCDVSLGSEFVQYLGPPLSIVLDGARWLAAELTMAARRHLRQRYAEIAGRLGAPLEAHRFLGEILTAGEESFIALARRRAPISPDIARCSAWIRRFPNRASATGRREKSARAARALRLRRDLVALAVSARHRDRRRRRRGVSPRRFRIVLGEVHGLNSLLFSALTAQHPDANVIALLARHAV